MLQQAWKAFSQLLTWPKDSLDAGILGQQLESYSSSPRNDWSETGFLDGNPPEISSCCVLEIPHPSVVGPCGSNSYKVAFLVVHDLRNLIDFILSVFGALDPSATAPS